MGIVLRIEAKKGVDFETLLQEWVNLKADIEFTKNRLIYYSKKLMEIEKAKKEYEKTLQTIGEILNTTEYIIFYHRYISQKKIWEIAQETKYSETHIKRIIKKIKKKINDTKMEL